MIFMPTYVAFYHIIHYISFLDLEQYSGYAVEGVISTSLRIKPIINGAEYG